MNIKTENNNFAFIDSQNLGIIADSWKLDFTKFRIFLKDKYNVEKSFLFIGYVKGNESLYTKFKVMDIFVFSNQL